MARSKIEFEEDARLETFAALEWYLERSEQVAERFLAEISRAVDSVSAAPKRWPEFGHGTRRFVLHQFPLPLSTRFFFHQSGSWPSRIAAQTGILEGAYFGREINGRLAAGTSSVCSKLGAALS